MLQKYHNSAFLSIMPDLLVDGHIYSESMTTITVYVVMIFISSSRLCAGKVLFGAFVSLAMYLFGDYWLAIEV